MKATEFFLTAARDLHKDLLEALKDLTDEQVHFRPLGKGNHIAFIIWHQVRTEDTVINLGLQKKKPIWNEEGWDVKFGLDPKTQGTGMPAEQAAALRINNLAEFRKYAEKVYAATESYMATVRDESLDEEKELLFLGKRTMGNVLGRIVVRHGAAHLGEIWYIKGLQGLKGSPI